MNRAELRQLAEDRILDAAALLAAGQFSGADYLAGYAVECGLKACILAHIKATGTIFKDRRYAEKCWTHDLEDLLALANLEALLTIDFPRTQLSKGIGALSRIGGRQAGTNKPHSQKPWRCMRRLQPNLMGCFRG